MTREGSIPQLAVKITLGCKCRILTANSLAAKPKNSIPCLDRTIFSNDSCTSKNNRMNGSESGGSQHGLHSLRNHGHVNQD